MRIFLFALFLAMQVSFSLQAEVVARFTPLNDDERFAFTTGRAHHIRESLVMYAVIGNNIEDRRELFIRGRASWARVYFSNDLRVGFFLAMPGETPDFDFALHNLYMANGNTGEIQRLISAIGVHTNFRPSKDGRFISFIRGDFSSNFATIILFDVETNAMSGEFEWKLTNPVDMWMLDRPGNNFRAFGLNEGGDIIALAKLDLATMELRTVWDETDPNLYWRGPGYNIWLDEGWTDDVFRQSRDPTVRLQR